MLTILCIFKNKKTKTLYYFRTEKKNLKFSFFSSINWLKKREFLWVTDYCKHFEEIWVNFGSELFEVFDTCCCYTNSQIDFHPCTCTARDLVTHHVAWKFRVLSYRLATTRSKLPLKIILKFFPEKKNLEMFFIPPQLTGKTFVKSTWV